MEQQGLTVDDIQDIPRQDPGVDDICNKYILPALEPFALHLTPSLETQPDS